VLRRSIRIATALVAVASLILLPQAAFASSPLADKVVVTTSTANDYTFSTNTPYWSVVGISTAVDWDLRLFDGGGTLLGSSTYGTGTPDFVAINSNLRAFGPYRASVFHFSGTGVYNVEQRQGNVVTPLPWPKNDGVSGAGDPDLGFATVQSPDVIRVTDVFLNAGESFWAKVASTNSNFFFLESNPADPATFTRTRAQAATIPGTRMAQGCTLYTAHYSGWHAFVVVNPDPPETTDPPSGLGYALHRFDPARPNTCPQRNFPGNTPPGP
jgi:hypothetical protein